MVEESVISSAWDREATDLGLCDAPQRSQGPSFLPVEDVVSCYPAHHLSFHDLVFPVPQDPSFWEGSLLKDLQDADLLSLAQYLPVTPPFSADVFLSTGTPSATSSAPSPSTACLPAPSSSSSASSQNLVVQSVLPNLYPAGPPTPPESPAPTVIATNLAAQQVRVITPSEVLPLSGKPIVAKQNKQKFPCSDCGKLYTQRRARDLHMLVHTGERPFVCDRCGAAFNRPGTLKVHRITEVCLRKQRRAFDQRASARAGRVWAHCKSMSTSK
ncbi:zinc finger protein 408-like isoform X2 [Penaeus japonicus]|uniref:zinc finger protein 408-like isoform X2 n=1 Tax=Penaeus japonicus TaxID=27405 RepID=UPI001C716EF6|nr:zinc finger protein 408-like isoform X2 [Penaeus japonicus]